MFSQFIRKVPILSEPPQESHPEGGSDKEKNYFFFKKVFRKLLGLMPYLSLNKR